MDWIQLLGYTAALCTTISFLPQAIKILKTKDTSGISLSMYAIFTAGVLLWLLFGVFEKNFPIILANGVTLILAVGILYFKIRYK